MAYSSEYWKEYYKKNRTRILAKQSAWYAQNKDRVSEYGKKYVKENRERHNENGAKSRLRRKTEAANAYGGKCECCGESRLAFLTIEHVGGWGKHHRKRTSVRAIHDWLKKHGYPKDGFALLCTNCNFATKNGKDCPHWAEMGRRPDYLNRVLDPEKVEALSA